MRRQHDQFSGIDGSRRRYALRNRASGRCARCPRKSKRRYLCAKHRRHARRATRRWARRHAAKVAAANGRRKLRYAAMRLSAWLDEYIRRQLFTREFDPMSEENWRLLRLDPVANHIIQTFGRKLPQLAEMETTAPPEIKQRQLSEVATLRVRESFSIETPKCIYERLPYPSRNGGFEQAFIEKANADSTAEAFCKVNEQKHLFMRLRYVRENGLPGFYHPDFLVRTATGFWLTETKAQAQLIQPDVIRKKIAAVAWCERVNELPSDQRGGRTWNYCLVGEALFYEFRDKGATMEEILQFSRVRARTPETQSLFG